MNFWNFPEVTHTLWPPLPEAKGPEGVVTHFSLLSIDQIEFTSFHLQCHPQWPMKNHDPVAVVLATCVALDPALF